MTGLFELLVMMLCLNLTANSLLYFMVVLEGKEELQEIKFKEELVKAWEEELKVV